MRRTRSVDTAETHPIAVVAQRTGLTPDVLRVWERRYGVVTPVRGPGGQRRYTADDIEHLRLLQAATRAGRSISEVASLSSQALKRVVDDDTAARGARSSAFGAEETAGSIVQAALASTLALDSAGLSTHLRRAVMQLGMPSFIEHVASPLLRRIGEEWHAGRLTPAQEHLASAVLQDMLMQTLRGVTSNDDAPRMLIATLAGERHAIGASLTAAAAAIEGWDVTFLGADLPARDIAAAAIATRARIVALSVIYVERRAAVLAEVRSLRKLLPADVTIVAGGSGAALLERELTAMAVRVGVTIATLSQEMRGARAVPDSRATPTTSAPRRK